MNNVVLIGRLVRDPELKYTESQMAVCTFTLAIDRPYSRDRQEKTADFIRIITFGKQAENCNRYLSKGRQTAIRGRIQTVSYTNRDGVKVYTTDIVADRVKFLSGQQKQEQQQTQTPQYQPPAAPRERQQRFDDIDDEIPEGFAVIDEDDIPF